MTHNSVGKETEQMVARWLRDEGGFPEARRIVRTGYDRPGGHTAADEGDIDTGAPVTVQCKSLRPVDRMERAVPGWLAETEAQRQTAGTDVGLLVVRRWGTTDVGRWWAFLRLRDLSCVSEERYRPSAPWGAPVRLEVRHATALLHTWGYGCPDIPTSATQKGETA